MLTLKFYCLWIFVSERHGSSVERIVIGVLLWPVYYGCISQVYAATAKDDNLQRAYFAPWARRAPLNSYATDPKMISKTIQWCQEQSKGF